MALRTPVRFSNPVFGALRSRLTATTPITTALPHSGRPFFSFPSESPVPLPSTAPQTLTASRSLPFPTSKLYAIIADIDSYSRFLPYCTSSNVTSWSNADSAGRRWPTRGDLTVGFPPITQRYSSRVYCVPERVVEAVSGPQGMPTLSAEELAALGRNAEAEALKSREEAQSNGDNAEKVFKSLVTRWTFAPTGAA